MKSSFRQQHASVGVQHILGRPGICSAVPIRTPFSSYELVSKGFNTIGPGPDGKIEEKPVVIDTVQNDLVDNVPGDIVQDMEVATDEMLDPIAVEDSSVLGSGYGGALLLAGQQRGPRKQVRWRTRQPSKIVIDQGEAKTMDGSGFHPKIRGNRMPEGRGILSRGGGLNMAGSGILTDISKEPVQPKFYKKQRAGLGKLDSRQSGYGLGLAGLGVTGSGLLPADALRKKIVKQLKKQKKALGKTLS